MAGFSIDHNNLPGVKEVCRDFAVLEDHCLAHNLQEQEIESHLASNVHKSRLAQQDLQVAKRLQEEEDLRAKAESHKHLRRIERIDNEMAQEIQDQLVRQAEQQRQQEEKDEAIARKLQEREMKEERKRQKHSEANFEDEYHEDKASKLPLDLHEQNSSYTSRKVKHQSYNSSLSPRNSPDPCKERPSSCSPDYDRLENGPPGRTNSPSKGKIPDYHSADRRRKDHQKDRNRLVDLDYTEPHRGKKQERRMDHNQAREDQEPIVRWKEKPTRDYSEDPDRMRERNRDNDRTRARVDERTHHRARNTDQGDKNERLFDSRLGEREENRERHKLQERSRQVDHGRSRGWSEERLEWDDHKNRTSEVFEDHPLRGLTNSPRQRGRKVQGEFGVREAARDLAHLDLQDLERHDMEVARRLQDEEIKASQVDKRASQVAQDEELARRLMEEEKKEYKKIKEKEKQAMERKRAEVEYKPVQDNAVRPRIREEMHSREDEFQRSRNEKPMRPPPPKQHYENINPGYAYPETPYAARPPPRPEAAYKGAYYRQ